MYIKIFESRNSNNSYLVRHDISIAGLDHGIMHIENQDKRRLSINENELFKIIDRFFKESLNEER